MKNYKITITLLFALCTMHLAGLADHITVQGEVSGQWGADTVLVTGDLTVPDGENLLIQPGTIVEFQGSFIFNVEGSISALGLVHDNIFFQVADTSGFYTDSIPDGGWRGIRFDHNRYSNDLSVFAFCHFYFGKTVSDDPMTGNGGAIYVKAYNKVSISNCMFQDNFATYNGGAIYLDSANISISNSSFARNRCGMAIAPYGYGGAICSDNSSPDIRWNIFDNNSSTGVGGGLAVRFKDCDVYNNVFRSNVSGLGGGFGILHITEINHRINNNLVAGNFAVYFGGGIASLDASPIYINNTIVYNQAMYGGGFYCKDSISPDFYNTIIWGNTAGVGPQGYLFEVYSQADFFNCDVEGGPLLFGGSGGGEAFYGDYESCLDENPSFMGSGDFPYALNDDSPCYDAGSWDTTGFFLPEYDLANNPRISHSAIDMGAYEIVWVGLPAIEKSEDLMKVWPNPTDGKFQITSTKSQTNPEIKNEIKKIEVLDLYGKVLSTLVVQYFCDRIESDISHLPPGIYIVRISLQHTEITKKLVKVSR
jgi:predicted outer membrane repeat protein